MDAPDARHSLFETAHRRAEWTIQELWLHSVAAGGTLTAFDIEAFLNGVMTIPPVQQDMLAAALNERIADLCEAAKVPYLTNQDRPVPLPVDPLAVLDELLGAARAARRSVVPPGPAIGHRAGPPNC